jgi:hypothetical protein
LVAAILLGFGAVAIAWSTYQAALWGGIQDEGYTESVREASNAVDLLQAADRISALDQLLFVELRLSGVCEEGEQADPVSCERVVASISDAGQGALAAWPGDDSSPFESQAYAEELYGPGEAARATSDEFFQEAGEANENGDNQELAATILTAVLFFAGIAAVMDDRRIGWALIVVSGLLLAAGIAYSATLPLA